MTKENASSPAGSSRTPSVTATIAGKAVPRRDIPLSNIVGKLLASRNLFTDIHVESGSPIMLRRSAGDWTCARSADGAEIKANHEAILAFVNGIFTGKEELRPSQASELPWETELKRHGSLHPASIIWAGAETGDPMPYRVRCTIQRQGMGESIGLVIRALHEVPTSIDKLGLPLQVSRMVANSTQGLIVVTGPTGSGKSTTLAAMIEEINRSRRNNILTIEDPIEFEFERDKSIINQREVHIDVPSFERGVQDALRFVPDVIMVGETRDAQTMRTVLRAAESGHLVLTSMHAGSAVGAIRKMLAYLGDNPADVQALGGCLVGIVAQALVRSNEADKSNALAYEVLNCRDNSVQQAVRAHQPQEALGGVEEKLRAKKIEGSTVFVDSLRNLVKAGKIDARRAAMAAPNNEDKAEFLRMAQAAQPPQAQ